MLKRAVLINDTRVDNHHGCDRVVASIVRRCLDIGVKIVQTSPAHTDWRKNSSFLKAFETADLVIVNGEGTIHHDRPAGQILLEAGGWAKQAGKPAALINCTWQNNGARSIKSLESFSLISVREGFSAAEIAKAGMQSFRVPDLSIDGIRLEQCPKIAIGITDSVVRIDILQLYSLLKRLPGAETCSIQYPTADIRGLCQFFRGYVGRDDLQHLKNLLSIIVSRYRQLGVSTRDGEAFLRLLASFRLLISGRFHATCMAIGLGTPFLTLSSNSHKTEGMLTDAGLLSRLVSFDEMTNERIESAMTWTPQELISINDYLADAAVQRHELFRRLRELL